MTTARSLAIIVNERDERRDYVLAMIAASLCALHRGEKPGRAQQLEDADAFLRYIRNCPDAQVPRHDDPITMENWPRGWK